MKTFSRLIELYKAEGFKVRTGLNPAHFNNYPYAPFTALYRDGRIMGTGGGIAPVEVCLFESLAEAIRPKNIFIIGNAFGWSTTAICMLFPDAKVVALDAESEGAQNADGNRLTEHIIARNGFDAVIERGFSPEAVAPAVERHSLFPIDLCFIDGLHTNEQLVKDFHACFPYLSDEAVVVCHDVLTWKMLEGFRTISREAEPRFRSMILERTPSGIGILYPSNAGAALLETIDLYHQEGIVYS